MPRRAFIIFMLLVFANFISGCSFLPSPDNTIASPRPKKNISSNNDDINSVIAGFIPSSSMLLIPKASSDKEPIHIVDLDGNGSPEIILTFMDEKRIIQSGFMILKKGSHLWEKQYEETDEYRNIKLIEFKDITGDNLPEIFIGKDNILNIYHYNGKQYVIIESIPFTEFSSSDISNKDGVDHMTELLVYNKVIDEPALNVLRWNGYMLQDVSDEFPNYKLELINYYEQILKENPRKSGYWYNLSKLQLGAAKYTDALASIEKAIFLESYPDTLLHYNIFKARILIRLERYSEAIQLVSSDALQRDSNISNCKSVIAESYFYQKDYIKAREIYEDIAVFPYDEDIQKVDAAIAEEKLYQYIYSFGENQMSEIQKKLEEFGYNNKLVINSTLPRSSVKDLSNVLIVDYHIAPVLAHGKDSVGAHLIYWWNNHKLYSVGYTTVGLYTNHNLIADLLSNAASIKVDSDGTIKMRITFQNSKRNKNNYPDALNQTFLFKNNEWKFFWK